MVSDSGDARLTVYLTDAPFPFDDAAAANVTILRIELVGADSTESIVISDSSQAFNLLELRNGVTAEIADVSVPPGDYSQLRIVVAEDASVVMKDSSEYALKIPSGSQSGIKINVPKIDLSGAGSSAELTVDFDVEKSFVVRGNSFRNGFLFKPVLKVVAVSLDGISVDLTGVSTDSGQ